MGQGARQMKITPIGSGRYAIPFHTAIKAARIPGLTWESGVGYVGYSDAMAVAAGIIKGLEIPQASQDEVYLPTATKGLRPYQNEAVQFLLTHKGAILADDMGLGKTCSALTAARALKSRTLVVVPSLGGLGPAIWWNSRDGGEVDKWWPAALGQEGEGIFQPRGLKPTDIDPQGCTQMVLIHYEILHAWAPAIAAWKPRVSIFDEGHALMSESSARSKAARLASRESEFRWVLTGTPMTSRPSDLWNVVDTVCPGRMGKFFDFGIRYCDAHQENVTPTKAVWKFDGASREEELGARLSHFMLRRTRTDVGSQLPAKQRQLISLAVPRRPLPKDLSKTALRKHLEVAADAKLDQVEALLLDHLANGRKVVCLTYRRAVAERLANAAASGGYKAAVIHGGIAPLRRVKAIESIAAASGGALLTATIDSAGLGINLSFAATAVFAEITWEPHEVLQAEARLGRIAGGEPILIQYPIATGTVDEFVVAKVLAKLKIRDKTVGSHDDNLSRTLSPDDGEDVFAAIAREITAAASP
jgi:SWI/SNF-related matrix-associated actin-dependent regulator 1 of chromatin subfamily A